MSDSAKKQQLMASIVDTFVSRGMLFTAFDVTKAMRKEDPSVIHGQIKGHIHNYCKLNMTYSKELVEINDDTEAWLYVPIGKNKEDYYLFDNPTAKTSAVAVNKATVKTPAPVSGNVTKMVTRTVDARGRLSIPPKFLREIGITNRWSKKPVKVYAGCNNSIGIEPDNAMNTGIQPIGQYFVNNGRIRISKRVLNKGIQLSGVEYDISVNSDCIIISEAD